MRAIVDTGPLVALYVGHDPYHTWAVARTEELKPPLLLCEPVLTEAMHVIRSRGGRSERLLAFVETGTIRIALDLPAEISAVRSLYAKYADRPMSLADACIVRMAELYDDHAVFTLDADFAVYRKHGRTPLRLMHPTIA
jgi:uncharacterized protein